MLSTTNANINHTQRDTLVCDSSIERGMNIHDNFEIIMCNTQLQQTIDERRVELLWFKVMLSRGLRYAPMLSLVTYPQRHTFGETETTRRQYGSRSCNLPSLYWKQIVIERVENLFTFKSSLYECLQFHCHTAAAAAPLARVTNSTRAWLIKCSFIEH